MATDDEDEDDDEKDIFDLSDEDIESFVTSFKEDGDTIIKTYPISLGDIRSLLKRMPKTVVKNIAAIGKIMMFQTDSFHFPILNMILNGMVLGAALILQEISDDDKPISPTLRED